MGVLIGASFRPCLRPSVTSYVHLDVPSDLLQQMCLDKRNKPRLAGDFYSLRAERIVIRALSLKNLPALWFPATFPRLLPAEAIVYDDGLRACNLAIDALGAVLYVLNFQEVIFRVSRISWDLLETGLAAC